MDSWKSRMKTLAIITLLTSGSQVSMFTENAGIFTRNIAYAESNVEIKNENNHWAMKDISRFVSLGIVKGDDRGNLNPDKNITRGEFCSILSKLLNLKEVDKNIFSDVKDEDWYRDDILKLKKLGIFKGNLENGQNLARANDVLTREEAVTLLSRAFNMTDENTESNGDMEFIDRREISSYAKASMDKFIREGYLNGYEDNTIKPKNSLSRAESMALISRIGGEIILKSGSYDGNNISSNVIIAQSDVKLKNMKIDKNIYLTNGAQFGNLDFENVNLIGKLYLEGKNIWEVKLKDTKIGKILADGGQTIILDNSSVTNLELGGFVRIQTLGSGKVEKILLNSNVKNLEVNGKKINVKDYTSNQLKDYINNETKEDKSKTTSLEVTSDRERSRSRSGGRSFKSEEKVSENKPDESKGERKIEDVKAKLVDRDKSKLVEIEGTRYLIVVLKKGSISDYGFKVDGKNEEFKKVSNDGRIVKCELKKDISKLELEYKNGERESISFGESIERDYLVEKDLEFSNDLYLDEEGNVKGSLSLKIRRKEGEFDLDSLSGATKKGSSKSIYLGPMPDELRANLTLGADGKTLLLKIDGRVQDENILKNRTFDFKLLSKAIKNTEPGFKQLDKTFKIRIEDRKEDEREEKIIAKIMEIEGTRYLILDHRILGEEVEEVLVDGVSRDFKSVNKDHSIKKLELGGKSPKGLTIKLKDKSIELKLN